jgi:hypothetical protein
LSLPLQKHMYGWKALCIDFVFEPPETFAWMKSISHKKMRLFLSPNNFNSWRVL